MKKYAFITHFNFSYFADKGDCLMGKISYFRSYKTSIFDAMQEFLSLKKV